MELTTLPDTVRRAATPKLQPKRVVARLANATRGDDVTVDVVHTSSVVKSAEQRVLGAVGMARSRVPIDGRGAAAESEESQLLAEGGHREQRMPPADGECGRTARDVSRRGHALSAASTLWVGRANVPDGVHGEACNGRRGMGGAEGTV